jgi:hypothetical protein
MFNKSKVTKEMPDIQEQIVMPINSRVGFYESGIKMKEVKQAIRTTAQEQFGTMAGVYYKIQKFNGGYAYEIHQGCDKGILSHVLDSVSEKDFILKTNHAKYKIFMKSIGHLAMLKLRDNDTDTDKFELVEHKDQLKPMLSTGYGFLKFGITLFIAGLIAFISGSAYKYLVVNSSQSIVFDKTEKATPIDYLTTLQGINRNLPRKGEYLTYVKYDKNDGTWNHNSQKVESLKDDIKAETKDVATNKEESE